MKQTASYKLSQWEKSDRLQMEDFNGDNAKIEAALKAQADTLSAHGASLDAMKTHAATLSAHQTAIAALNTAVSKRGNCQIQFITYKGANGGIQSKPKTLTFSHRPMAIFLFNNENHFLWAARGFARAPVTLDHRNPVFFTWNDRSISWYGSNSSIGMDDPICTHYAVVLLEIQ